MRQGKKGKGGMTRLQKAVGQDSTRKQGKPAQDRARQGKARMQCKAAGYGRSRRQGTAGQCTARRTGYRSGQGGRAVRGKGTLQGGMSSRTGKAEQNVRAWWQSNTG
jgi:hypothetical protein